MKSQCCNAEIKVDKGGVGVFSLTTGSYICSKCRKYCVKKPHEVEDNCPNCNKGKMRFNKVCPVCEGKGTIVWIEVGEII